MDTSNQIELFLELEENEIQKFKDSLDINSIQMAKDLIINAEKLNHRVHVTGIGKPGHVAGYVASLLSSTGTPTYELHGTEAVHGSAGQVKEGDVVIAISNSGETNELKYTVRTLKQNHAKIISVTSKQDSWLAKQGDVVLLSGVDKEGDTLNKPPRLSIIAEILVLQALSIALQSEKELTLNEYVKWHPGGKLGESIRKEEQ